MSRNVFIGIFISLVGVCGSFFVAAILPFWLSAGDLVPNQRDKVVAENLDDIYYGLLVYLGELDEQVQLGPAAQFVRSAYRDEGKTLVASTAFVVRVQRFGRNLRRTMTESEQDRVAELVRRGYYFDVQTSNGLVRWRTRHNVRGDSARQDRSSRPVPSRGFSLTPSPPEDWQQTLHVPMAIDLLELDDWVVLKPVVNYLTKAEIDAARQTDVVRNLSVRLHGIGDGREGRTAARPRWMVRKAILRWATESDAELLAELLSSSMDRTERIEIFVRMCDLAPESATEFIKSQATNLAIQECSTLSGESQRPSLLLFAKALLLREDEPSLELAAKLIVQHELELRAIAVPRLIESPLLDVRKRGLELALSSPADVRLDAARRMIASEDWQFVAQGSLLLIRIEPKPFRNIAEPLIRNAKSFWDHCPSSAPQIVQKLDADGCERFLLSFLGADAHHVTANTVYDHLAGKLALPARARIALLGVQGKHRHMKSTALRWAKDLPLDERRAIVSTYLAVADPGYLSPELPNVVKGFPEEDMLAIWEKLFELPGPYIGYDANAVALLGKGLADPAQRTKVAVWLLGLHPRSQYVPIAFDLLGDDKVGQETLLKYLAKRDGYYSSHVWRRMASMPLSFRNELASRSWAGEYSIPALEHAQQFLVDVDSAHRVAILARMIGNEHPEACLAGWQVLRSGTAEEIDATAKVALPAKHLNANRIAADQLKVCGTVALIPLLEKMADEKHTPEKDPEPYLKLIKNAISDIRNRTAAAETATP